MYMKKILIILIIILLPIFSLLIYFIYNEMKISNEIAKIEENIEKLYKKNKLCFIFKPSPLRLRI